MFPNVVSPDDRCAEKDLSRPDIGEQAVLEQAVSCQPSVRLLRVQSNLIVLATKPAVCDPLEPTGCNPVGFGLPKSVTVPAFAKQLES